MYPRITRGHIKSAKSEGEITLDSFLHEIGLWRKMIPKDGSCLFRIASEKENVDPEDSNFLLHYLSLVMKKDISIFWSLSTEMKPCTFNKFPGKIMLCTVDDKHFDLVYPLEHVASNALCQSIVYEVLYENVFGVIDCMGKSRDMMKKEPITPKTPYIANGHFFPSSPFEMNSNYVRTAFPYKVAKSLAVDILRNVEYDAWLESKKARNCGFYSHFDKNVPVPGDKCQVTLPHQKDSPFDAHIQEVQHDKNRIVVFVEGLGEKHIVPSESVKLIAKANQFDFFWRKRNKKKNFDSCLKNMSCNNDNNLIQTNNSTCNKSNSTGNNMSISLASNNSNNNSNLNYTHTSRISSVGHPMHYNAHDSSTNQPRYAPGKDTSMDYHQKYKSMKERSYSDGHYKSEYHYENGDISVDGVHMEGDIAGYDPAMNVFYEETKFHCQSTLTQDNENLLAEDAATPTNAHPPSYLIIGENVVRTGSTNETDAPASPVGANTDGVMMMQYQIPHIYTTSPTATSCMLVPIPNAHLLNYDNYSGPINFQTTTSVDHNGGDLPINGLSIGDDDVDDDDDDDDDDDGCHICSKPGLPNEITSLDKLQPLQPNSHELPNTLHLQDCKNHTHIITGRPGNESKSYLQSLFYTLSSEFLKIVSCLDT